MTPVKSIKTTPASPVDATDKTSDKLCEVTLRLFDVMLGVAGGKE